MLKRFTSDTRNILQVDFAMGCETVGQVMSALWNRRTVQLFTAAVWYKETVKTFIRTPRARTRIPWRHT